MPSGEWEMGCLGFKAWGLGFRGCLGDPFRTLPCITTGKKVEAMNKNYTHHVHRGAATNASTPVLITGKGVPIFMRLHMGGHYNFLCCRSPKL